MFCMRVKCFVFVMCRQTVINSCGVFLCYCRWQSHVFFPAHFLWRYTSNCYNILRLFWTTQILCQLSIFILLSSLYVCMCGRKKKTFGIANVFNVCIEKRVLPCGLLSIHTKTIELQWQYKFTLFPTNIPTSFIVCSLVHFWLFCELKPRKMFYIFFCTFIFCCLRVFQRIFFFFLLFSHFSCHAIGYRNVQRMNESECIRATPWCDCQFVFSFFFFFSFSSLLFAWKQKVFLAYVTTS